MRKTIFKFWLINFIACIMLYMAYRVLFIAGSNSKEKDLGIILDILNILFNLGFSLIYLITMAICSLTIFLNSATHIRQNSLLSLLTFSGLPAMVAIILAVKVIKDFGRSGESILTAPWIFSITYLIFTLITFLLFSKRIQRNAKPA